MTDSNILLQLSMMSTGITPDESEGGFATPYFGEGEVPEFTPSAVNYAGSIYSTIHDLYVWEPFLIPAEHGAMPFSTF
jgi:hypothetical protein